MLRAVERLALNDAAIEWEREQSPALGMGLRMGFLGVLHMEVRGLARARVAAACLDVGGGIMFLAAVLIAGGHFRTTPCYRLGGRGLPVAVSRRHERCPPLRYNT